VLCPPDLLHRRQVCLTPPAQTEEYTELGIKVCRCRQDFMAGNSTFHVARMQQWTISCADQGFVALLSRHACELTCSWAVFVSVWGHARTRVWNQVSIAQRFAMAGWATRALATGNLFMHAFLSFSPSSSVPSLLGMCLNAHHLCMFPFMLRPTNNYCFLARARGGLNSTRCALALCSCSRSCLCVGMASRLLQRMFIRSLQACSRECASSWNLCLPRRLVWLTR
jgi:hypothetical protein